MKLYKANHYYRPAHGLDIFDEHGATVIIIKADSSKETERLARKILAELNQDYYTKTAYLADHAELYNFGLITKEEQNKKDAEIMAMNF